MMMIVVIRMDDNFVSDGEDNDEDSLHDEWNNSLVRVPFSRMKYYWKIFWPLQLVRKGQHTAKIHSFGESLTSRPMFANRAVYHEVEMTACFHMLCAVLKKSVKIFCLYLSFFLISNLRRPNFGGYFSPKGRSKYPPKMLPQSVCLYRFTYADFPVERKASM